MQHQGTRTGRKGRRDSEAPCTGFSLASYAGKKGLTSIVRPLNTDVMSYDQGKEAQQLILSLYGVDTVMCHGGFTGGIYYVWLIPDPIKLLSGGQSLLLKGFISGFMAAHSTHAEEGA